MTGPGLMGNAVAGIASMPAAAPGVGAQTAPPPTEAEWNGLEVSGSAQGVIVAAAEGTSAQTGVQKGDVVVSVNGLPVRTVADFANVTQNGTLPQGAMIVQRNGQRLAVELGAAAAAAPTPGPYGLPAGGMAQAPASYPQNNPGCAQMGRF
jgi:S1-C subfamily serine protease